MKKNGKFLSFHGKPEIKTKYLNRLRLHYRADEIIKGVYWENGKGCAVGCTIHSSNYLHYEKELGIPSQLAGIEDYLFEKLDNGQAKQFPIQFLNAIPIGVDLQPVWKKFVLANLRRLLERDMRGFTDVVASIEIVIKFYEEWLGDLHKNNSAAARAASAAWEAASAAWEAASAASAAESAARAARAASAAWAANAAADSAARAAAWAADSAARAAANAAWNAEVIHQRDALLALLAKAK